MDDIIFQLIFGAFLGAVSGYYTNVIALKKLFSNNGIIAREKSSFIDEISKMVSKKIINFSTIYKELKKDKFKNNIKIFFKNIKNKLILKTALKIKNINGFEKSKDNILNWTKENTNESILFIFEKLSKNTKLSQIINENHSKEIIKVIINSFYEYINKDTISNIINKAYKDNEDNYKKILIEIINNAFDKASKNNNENLKNDTANIIKELIKYSKIEKSFYDTSNSILNNKINDLFSINSADEIKEIINILANNEDFENIINDLIEEIYKKLKNTDKTIYELLNPNMSDRLKFIIENLMPKFIDAIIPLISENKQGLEKIIEEAVDEEIENIDNFLMKIIVQGVRNFFFKDIASKYKIIQKVIEYAEKAKHNSNDIAEITSKDIMNYLNKTKISKILSSINDISTIKEIIKDIIIFNIKHIPNSWIDNFLNIKLNTIIDSQMIEDLFHYLEKEIINYASLNSNTVLEKIKTSLCQKIYSLDEKTIFIILKDNNIINIISKNKESIENFLYSFYLEYKDKTIDELLNNDFESIINSVFDLFEKFIDEYSNLNLNELIINKENQIDEFFENNAYNSVMNFIDKEKSIISNIIDTIVIKTIQNNMGKLSKDEIADMANDFMGKELEPINIFGAFLGALFGILTAYFFPPDSFNSSYKILNYIAEPLVYTSIGLITNILAIYSIFQPYEPLFGIKKKIFWGAVACEKGRFAESMSDFVNDRLMEKEGIIDIINNKEDIENNLIKDNYKIFFNYMLEDEKIENLNIYSSLKNNLNNIISNDKALKSGIINFIKDNDYLEKIKSNKKIKKELIEFINKNADNIFSSILDSLIKNIDPNSIKILLENAIKNNLKDLSKFKNIIVPNIIKAINNDYVRNKIFSLIEDFIDNEISKKSNEKIKYMFEGELVKVVENNNEFIFSMIQNKLVDVLNNNKIEIRNMIMENMPVKNDFVINLVDKIILNLISRKLPIFVNNMKDDIMNVSFNFLDKNILSKEVSYFIGEEKLYESKKLKKYLNEAIDNNQDLINMLVEKTFDLLIVNIDLSIIEKYINALLENTNEEIYNFIKEILINIYYESSNISNDIKKYIENNIDSIQNIINAEKYFDDIFDNIIDSSKDEFNNFLVYIEKKDFICKEKLITSLYELINNIEKDEAIQKLTFIEIKKIISKLRNDLPDIIDDEMKHYALSLIIDNAKEDVNLIIDSIDFASITKEEIDKMNPKNIHDVFDSFASKYLNRLKLYGMFGGAVGIFIVIIKLVSNFNSNAGNILNIVLIAFTIIFSASMIMSILKNTLFKKN